MKIKLFHFVLVALILMTGTIFARPPVMQYQPQVLEQAKEYPLEGRLQQTKDGYTYVKVDDRYITDLIRLIDTTGRMRMPRSMTTKNGIGAHISVFYANELQKLKIHELPELGEKYSFKIKEIQTIDQQVLPRQRLWIITVEAPELEQLRRSYGMKPLLKGHEFHITIGMETRKYKKK